MNSTYYTSLSGMMAASYGLQNTSNNIANMQSPGFKRNDVFYSSLGNNSNPDQSGSGVYVGGHGTSFTQGTCHETNNPCDMAIVGNGYFIVRLANDELLYTRDGEFGFEKGILTDKHSGGIVQGFNKQGTLVPISQYGSDVSPGKATTHIDLKGELVVIELENNTPGPQDPSPTKSKYEQLQFDVSIYDEKGKTHKISLTFESPTTPTPGQFSSDNKNWNLTNVSCHDDVKIQYEFQSIEFDDVNNGACTKSHNTIDFKLNDQSITLNFGDYTKGNDASSSVRLYKKDQAQHPKTDISEIKQDGYGFGRQTGCSFDDNGLITYQYDNGQKEEGLYVALSRFDDQEHTLVQAHDNLFRAKNLNGQHIGRANKDNFGTIQPKKLETSNVDSTHEFANIVVLQRMFQACSQIMEIDKQLLEELYKK